MILSLRLKQQPSWYVRKSSDSSCGISTKKMKKKYALYFHFLLFKIDELDGLSLLLQYSHLNLSSLLLPPPQLCQLILYLHFVVMPLSSTSFDVVSPSLFNYCVQLCSSEQMQSLPILLQWKECALLCHPISDGNLNIVRLCSSSLSFLFALNVFAFFFLLTNSL